MESKQKGFPRVSYIETAFPGTECDLCHKQAPWVNHYEIEHGIGADWLIAAVWAHRTCFDQHLESRFAYVVWEGEAHRAGSRINRGPGAPVLPA
jgi:hypothetical protein